ncbi:MAG: glutamyl-tRNA reductase [Flavobacteriales bacterium]
MHTDHLHIVSLHHRNVAIERIGQMHVPEDRQAAFLEQLKATLGVEGIAYLTTCNRVEFMMVDEAYFCMGRLQQLFQAFSPDEEAMRDLMANAMVVHGEEAARHLLRVSAGLESMVLGEREILTQVRTAMEKARQWGVAGDQLRITERIAVETAKRVFTETDIARKSVSVNALGWKAFRDWGLPKDAPLLMIGAGQTNANIARYLVKEGYTHVHVLNRTVDRANALAAPRGWTSAGLDTLSEALAAGPAAIFLCTGSDEPLLDATAADRLPDGPLHVLDLSVPAGVSPAFRDRPDTHVTGIAELKPLAEANTAGRRAALGDCQRIVEEGLTELASRLQQRNVERALRDLPTLLAEVRGTALNEVFADELSTLDGDTRELVDRIVHYLEKKYISLPMKLAKEVVMDQLDQG